MNIAIIGAGNVGSNLAGALVKAGHDVVIATRTMEKTTEIAATTGSIPATNAAAAAALGDVIVLAVPFGAAKAVASEIRPVVNGKTIVDVTNPAKADWSGPLFEGADSGAEQLARWLPEANVVKAFNTVLASNLADPSTDGVALDGYVAGDDADAKARALEIVASTGLNPVDAGPLVAARQLEALAWLNISLNVANGWAWRTGWKLVGAPANELARAA